MGHSPQSEYQASLLEITQNAALCFRSTLVILEYFIKLARNNKSTVFHDDSSRQHCTILFKSTFLKFKRRIRFIVSKKYFKESHFKSTVKGRMTILKTSIKYAWLCAWSCYP